MLCAPLSALTGHTAHQVRDLNSLNGLLHNGIRTEEAVLEDQDLITFGGAADTEMNQAPAPKAIKSIYEYRVYIPQSAPELAPGPQSQSLGGF
jgi:hypothetical protein